VTLADDYRRFHRLAVETGDVDPVYPVLRHYAGTATQSTEERLRLTFLHVAYYNLASAIRVWWDLGTQAEQLRLPTGHERRAHRNEGKLTRHLAQLDYIAKDRGGYSGFLERAMEGARTPEERWEAISDAVLSMYGNGRWAAYKTCEMLAKVNGYELHAPDMGHAYSSGPRQGLELLVIGLPTGNGRYHVQMLDAASRALVGVLAESGLPGADNETVETTLCDFHSMVTGGYYVGHDIDSLLAVLTPYDGKSLPGHGVLMEARRASFPDPYLGELHGWSRPDRVRKRVYQRTRQIVERKVEVPA
jgi:hypothetical protein